jgi:magnesium-transporting ATPase (P-type)
MRPVNLPLDNINMQIADLPLGWKIVMWSIILLGIVFVFGFLIDYMTRMNWRQYAEGKHLVSVSANLGAFFVLFLILAIWPDFPGRGLIRLVLLIAIVANCGWRWRLFRKNLKEHRRNR